MWINTCLLLVFCILVSESISHSYSNEDKFIIHASSLNEASALSGIPIDQITSVYGLHSYYFIPHKPLLLSKSTDSLLFIDHSIDQSQSPIKNKYEIDISPYYPDDPFFPKQWHLHNTGQQGATPGVDISAPLAWNRTRGANVTIAVLDDGVDFQHLDLEHAYVPELSVNYADGNVDPSFPFVSGSASHGTSCAGILAARADGTTCGVGVAPDCDLAGRRVLGVTFRPSMLVHALLDGAEDISVFSCSFGPAGCDSSGCRIETLSGRDLIAAALAQGFREGRGGRGSMYFFPAGNEGAWGGRANDYWSNRMPESVVVSALSGAGTHPSYSARGPAVLLATPSSGTVAGRSLALTTIATRQRCISTFGGTSGAVPIAAGAAGLLLSYAPDMSSSDVMWVMALSADPLASPTFSWAVNGAGLPFSEEVGFGLLDTDQMMAISDLYIPTDPTLLETLVIDAEIPDGIITMWSDMTTSVTFTVPDDFSVLSAGLGMELRGSRIGGVAVTLTSPDDTASRILVHRKDTSTSSLSVSDPLKTVAVLGENAKGVWNATFVVSGFRGDLTKSRLVLTGFHRPLSVSVSADQVSEDNDLATFTFKWNCLNTTLVNQLYPQGATITAVEDDARVPLGALSLTRLLEGGSESYAPPEALYRYRLHLIPTNSPLAALPHPLYPYAHAPDMTEECGGAVGAPEGVLEVLGSRCLWEWYEEVACPTGVVELTAEGDGAASVFSDDIEYSLQTGDVLEVSCVDLYMLVDGPLNVSYRSLGYNVTTSGSVPRILVNVAGVFDEETVLLPNTASSVAVAISPTAYSSSSSCLACLMKGDTSLGCISPRDQSSSVLGSSTAHAVSDLSLRLLCDGDTFNRFDLELLVVDEVSTDYTRFEHPIPALNNTFTMPIQADELLSGASTLGKMTATQAGDSHIVVYLQLSEDEIDAQLDGIVELRVVSGDTISVHRIVYQTGVCRGDRSVEPTPFIFSGIKMHEDGCVFNSDQSLGRLRASSDPSFNPSLPWRAQLVDSGLESIHAITWGGSDTSASRSEPWDGGVGLRLEVGVSGAGLATDLTVSWESLESDAADGVLDISEAVVEGDTVTFTMLSNDTSRLHDFLENSVVLQCPVLIDNDVVFTDLPVIPNGPFTCPSSVALPEGSVAERSLSVSLWHGGADVEVSGLESGEGCIVLVSEGSIIATGELFVNTSGVLGAHASPLIMVALMMLIVLSATLY